MPFTAPASNVGILDLKRAAFVLWRPHETNPVPKLIIGRFQPGNPPSLVDRKEHELEPLPGHPDVFGIDAAACGLTNNTVYHYWFEVTDSSRFHEPPQRILCTDPTALTVDWRLKAPRVQAPNYSEDDRHPAAVLKFLEGKLVPAMRAVSSSARRLRSRLEKARPIIGS